MKKRNKNYQRMVLVSLLTLIIISIIPIINAQDNPKTGTISGKVLPIDSNAIVYVYYLPYSDLRIAASAEIDDGGEYSITVPTGVYDIVIVAEGDYIDRSIRQIGVEENQVTEVKEVTLAKEGDTGSISGYITPIVEGTVVKIKKFGEVEFDNSVVVASDGSYKITDLEPGTYGLFIYLDPSKSSFDYKWGMIDIEAGVELSEFNITIRPNTGNYVIDQVLVEFHNNVLENERMEIIKKYGCRLMSHYSYSSHYTINIPSDKTVEEMVEIFRADPGVKLAYRNLISHTLPAEIIEIGDDNDGMGDLNEDDSTEDLVEQDEISEKEEEKSWFSKIIQFFRSLFSLSI